MSGEGRGALPRCGSECAEERRVGDSGGVLFFARGGGSCVGREHGQTSVLLGRQPASLLRRMSQPESSAVSRLSPSSPCV